MTLPTDYVDGDVLTAADVNAITTAVNGNIPASTIAAKGDLLVGLTNDSVGVLSVGTNGYLLSASSGAASGLAWTAASGKLLGFSSLYYGTNQATTSATATDIPNVNITYTPNSATSTIIVEITGTASVVAVSGDPDPVTGYIQIANSQQIKLGTDLVNASTDLYANYGPAVVRGLFNNTNTSPRNYKGQFFVDSTVTTGGVVEIGLQGVWLTVMEIAS